MRQAGVLDAETNVVTEIEITPEMIEAGLQAYSLYRDGEDSPAEIISHVYRAMSGGDFL